MVFLKKETAKKKQQQERVKKMQDARKQKQQEKEAELERKLEEKILARLKGKATPVRKTTSILKPPTIKHVKFQREPQPKKRVAAKQEYSSEDETPTKVIFVEIRRFF